MKNLQSYLFVAILGIGLGYVIFGKADIEVDIDAYQVEINLLQQKIDSINIQNNTLKLEADSLAVKISKYDSKITKLNTKINVIKYETQQKINAVDSFGDDELERFFAERYLEIKGQQKDTVN
jgi:regulator of replication initiation timing